MFEWSVSQLERCAAESALLIDPIVYAEVSIGFEQIEKLEAQLRTLDLRIQPLPKEALFLAGNALLDYRRRGGQRQTPLPDFFIGAHAAVQGWRLLTRDAARFRTYFPSLELIDPARQ